MLTFLDPSLVSGPVPLVSPLPGTWGEPGCEMGRSKGHGDLRNDANASGGSRHLGCLGPMPGPHNIPSRHHQPQTTYLGNLPPLEVARFISGKMLETVSSHCARSLGCPHTPAPPWHPSLRLVPLTFLPQLGPPLTSSFHSDSQFVHPAWARTC